MVKTSLITNILCLFLLAAMTTIYAGPTQPDARDPDAFDFMDVLTQKGWHDHDEERWNAYGQLTYISSWKGAFPAAYTNRNGTPNSLSPSTERSYTFTATAFLGARLWTGGEFYLVPEMIVMRPLSNLAGLGGTIQNFELQRSGSETPYFYFSRSYLKQTINLGGGKTSVASEPMHLGTNVDKRRLVFRIGHFSMVDFFDQNNFSSDLRRQFFNMAFLSYAAHDYASDGRGYTWGGVIEYIHNDWAVRFGHAAVPLDPNQLVFDTRIFQYFGEQLEIEKKHEILGQSGAIRLMLYRNQVRGGRYEDAMAAFQADASQNATTCPGFNFHSANANAPDLCWARKTNVKTGIGINLEQQVYDDLGFFMRGMYSDGQTEVYSYTSTDRSLSAGVLIKGKLWGRKRDTLGFGYAQGWISAEHAAYLDAGGADLFIGDGNLNQRSEQLVEVFYSLCIYHTIWISVDYQHIANPAYNGDRGPVDILGMRLHTEF